MLARIQAYALTHVHILVQKKSNYVIEHSNMQYNLKAKRGMHTRAVSTLCLNMYVCDCMSAVKSRPVLHHCVVIFIWSSGIMECTCMLFTFENGDPLMR